jgi:hypothetical protein
LKTPLLITLVAAALTTTVLAGAEPKHGPIPSDFRVTIHHYPGLSDWKPFETTIAADGSVEQTVYIRGSARKSRSRIPTGSVARLYTEIQKADFFSLAEKYPTDAEDCATYVIAVHANSRKREVTFATCFRKPGTEADSKRFLKVWFAALRAFPSPNADQKPPAHSQ